RDHARVIVSLGPRTVVDDVEIRFAGDLALEDEERIARRQALRESWALKQGQPLRSSDWEDAKSRLHEKLIAEDYAAGKLASSVGVDIDRDPGHPQNVPVKVSVTERPSREIGVALGYGTDSGARGEVAVRHRNLFGRGLDLQSAVRVDRASQIGYSDFYLPPG